MASKSWLILLYLVVAVPAQAQAPLTLDEAVSRALAGHSEARAASLAVQEAGEQAVAARSALMPRVDLTEGWQRGNLPVFAFSSILAQRQFTAADFDASRLNHPGALDDFRTAIAFEQPVFDAAIRPALRTATLGKEVATAVQRRTLERLQLDTTATYARVLQLTGLVDAASEAASAAAQDRERARARRDAGMATDADVLMSDVQVSAVRARQIEATAELTVARAQLNDLIGAPLDTVFELAPPTIADPPSASIADLEAEAIRERADVEMARLQKQSAAAGLSAARAAFLPRIVARGTTEWHGATFGTQTSGWAIGAEARLNLFNGFSDRARLGSARLAADRREVEQGAVEAAARLEVRAALARRQSAAARLDLALAAVAQATETQRIVRDRYESGLADVVSMLRASQALLEARAQHTTAQADLLQQQVALQIALGRGGR